MEQENLKKTALHDVHASLGAKIIPFAGFLMPVQYRGIIREHLRVRTTVGIFDVSHMGEFELRGDGAAAFLNWITTNDVSRLSVGQVQYSAMCYPHGGIVDDLLVYRLADRYFMVVNAANLVKDRDWILEHLPRMGVEFADKSNDVTLLAVQGPRSADLLRSITPVDLSKLGYYRFLEGEVAGIASLISRTGYTGELGYEIYVHRSQSEVFWRALFRAGQPYEVEPIGLGARDTLRLEMKYCLYGNDIDATTNPLEAGLGWITRLDKGNFIGRDAVLALKERGAVRKLIGFEMMDKGIPRQGYPILHKGNQVGLTTSGNYSPMLEWGIGLGYLPVNLSSIGTELALDLRGRQRPIRVVETPFYHPAIS